MFFIQVNTINNQDFSQIGVSQYYKELNSNFNKDFHLIIHKYF